MRRTLLPLLALALLCSSTSAFAEDDADSHSFPLVVAGLQEATAVPFAPNTFTGPLHPGLMVGSEYEYTRGGWGRLFQTANFSFFYHADYDAVASLNSEFGYGYDFDFGLGLEALVGLGYGHTFNARTTYSLETREETADLGQPAIIGSAGVGVTYDLRRDNLMPATLFVRYQPQLQVALGSDSPLGVLPRTTVSVGAKIHF